MRRQKNALIGFAASVILTACGGPTPLVTPDGGSRLAANDPAPLKSDSNEKKLAILNGQMVTVIDPTPQDIQGISVSADTALVPAKEQIALADPVADPKAPNSLMAAPALPNDGPIAVPVALTEFTADAGASLKTALGDWLQANGWRLSWRAEGSSPGRVRDFRVTEPVAIQPTSIPNLLNQLLPGRGLHAIVSNKSKAVLIENDANAIGQRGE